MRALLRRVAMSAVTSYVRQGLLFLICKKSNSRNKKPQEVFCLMQKCLECILPKSFKIECNFEFFFYRLPFLSSTSAVT